MEDNKIYPPQGAMKSTVFGTNPKSFTYIMCFLRAFILCKPLVYEMYIII